MDLPVIDPPIFPRWVWIEEITYSHIPIATLINTLVLLAPIYEYIGIRRQDPRYDRLARGFVTFSLILFSPGAALGTGIPMWIMGTYPEFWSRWSNLFFWPLVAQFAFFLGEVVFLFFFYYLAWEKLRDRKTLHVALGCVAAAFTLLVQAVWDALGSYMLTPAAPLPAINEPVAWSAAAFFNPSFPFLFWHRFFGNLSYVMLLVGGVFAVCAMKTRDEPERDYYAFAARATFPLGYLAFFAMPLIGWGYASVIRQHAPVAFHALMGGHVAPHFLVKMFLVGAMVALGAVHLFAAPKNGRPLRLSVSAGLLLVLFVLLAHPPLPTITASRPVWTLGLLSGFAAFLFLLWRFVPGMSGKHPFWQWSKLVVGLLAFGAFLIGGFVRERSRSPYTVYKEIVKPEVVDREADRFLFYDKCLGCHSVAELTAERTTDWPARVAAERQRHGLDLSDEQAAAIVRHLEDGYR
ncbi:MAG: cytochrome ubiquinol oxidase subunit I [Thermodesulfobacteriota bacterium]